MAQKKNRWQKALDESNVRQGQMNPRYKSRLAEEKMKANKTVEKARALPHPPKPTPKPKKKVKKKAKKKVNR